MQNISNYHVSKCEEAYTALRSEARASSHVESFILSKCNFELNEGPGLVIFVAVASLVGYVANTAEKVIKAVALPLYRACRNIVDIFRIAVDLFNAENQGKRGARFFFNVTSTLVLDPLSTFGGIAQMIVRLVETVIYTIPFTASISYYILKVDQFFEVYLTAAPKAQLAISLSLETATP